MSTNKNLLITLILGTAMAGISAYLLVSRNEVKVVRKEKNKENGIGDKIEDIIEEAKQKFSNLKQDFVKEFEKEAMSQEEY